MNARLLSSVVLIGALVSFATGESTPSTSLTTKSLRLTTILSTANRTVNNKVHESTTWPKSWSSGAWSTSKQTPPNLKGESVSNPESETVSVSQSPSIPNETSESSSHSIEVKGTQPSDTEITETQTSLMGTCRNSEPQGETSPESSVVSPEGREVIQTIANESPSSETGTSESPSSETGMNESPFSHRPMGMSESPSSETGMGESSSTETPAGMGPEGSTEESGRSTFPNDLGDSSLSHKGMSVSPLSNKAMGESPSSETRMSESSSSETEMDKRPVSHRPMGMSESPSSETGMSEKPVSHRPMGMSESQSSETGMSEKPVSHRPVGMSESPSSETGMSESPSSETGMSEKPVSHRPMGTSESQSAETPHGRSEPTEEGEISTPSTETTEHHTNNPPNPNPEPGNTEEPKELKAGGKKPEDVKEVIRMLNRTEQEVVQVKKQVDKLVDQSIHKLDIPCNIDVVSVSASSRGTKGSILVNKRLCAECDSLHNSGLSVCVIDPAECRSKYTRHFKTNDADVVTDGVAFDALVSSENDHMTIVGTSCGDSVSGLGEGKIALKVHGADVDDVPKTGMYGFIIQTKDPSKGIVVKNDRQNPSALKIKFMITGKDSKNYGYKMVSHD